MENKKGREDLGLRILQNCQNELYSYFPYLDGAFAGLPYRPEDKAGTIGTDGEFLRFSPDFLPHWSLGRLYRPFGSHSGSG